MATSLSEIGVGLEARAWIRPPEAPERSASRVLEVSLAALADAGIELARPLRFRMDADVSLILNVRIVSAYSLILDRVYGIDLGVEYPWVVIVTDPDTKLDRYFKLIASRRFLEVDVIGEVPPLPEEAVRRSIRGMLPKGPLGRQQITKLQVYAGPTHPHAAQQPTPLEIPAAKAR